MTDHHFADPPSHRGAAAFIVVGAKTGIDGVCRASVLPFTASALRRAAFGILAPPRTPRSTRPCPPSRSPPASPTWWSG